MKQKVRKIICFFLSFVMICSVLPTIPVQAATKLSDMSGKTIIKTLKTYGFPISSYKIYTTNKSDPNHLIGKPNQYTCKVDFYDEDYPGSTDDYSCTFEIFNNESDASTRKNYLQSVFKAIPSFAQRTYQYSNIVLRIDYAVSSKRAKYYKNAFSDMSQGKTPKFPISLKKNLSITVGKTKTLKTNIAAKKIKWKSSNKRIATVSKKGKVTAKKVGKATITAKCNGYTAKCKVEVKNNLSELVKEANKNIIIETTDLQCIDNPNTSATIDSISFRITNNSPYTITIDDSLEAYDDSHPLNLISTKGGTDVSLLPGEEKTITFESSENILYYARMLILEFEINGDTIYCDANYTYDNSQPYSFKFYKLHYEDR